MLNHEHAKSEMKKRGHSCRSAAQAIGKSYPWVCDVLNGKKTSRPVLEAICRLPLRTPPRVSLKRYPKEVQKLANAEEVKS